MSSALSRIEPPKSLVTGVSPFVTPCQSGCRKLLLVPPLQSPPEPDSNAPVIRFALRGPASPQSRLLMRPGDLLPNHPRSQSDQHEYDTVQHVRVTTG